MASRKNLHRPIADWTASEMSLEVNILRHLANCLELRGGLAPGSVTMTSPTQNDEDDLGYDAVVGQPNGRYALLQFKRPDPDTATLSFRIPARQVYTLSWWPPRSAFFVLPAVKKNRDLWAAGPSLLGMSRIVDVWDLYTPFDKIGLLAPRQDGYPGPAARTVRVDKSGGSAMLNAAEGLKRRWRSLQSRPISCLCGVDASGIVVENGEARTWDGRKWNQYEWQREARERWHRRAVQDSVDSGGRAPSEHSNDGWIKDLAGILWASRDGRKRARKRSLRDSGHPYMLPIGR